MAPDQAGLLLRISPLSSLAVLVLGAISAQNEEQKTWTSSLVTRHSLLPLDRVGGHDTNARRPKSDRHRVRHSLPNSTRTG